MRCFLATQLQAEWRDTVPGIQKWLVTAKLLLCSAEDFGDSEHRTARPTKAGDCVTIHRGDLAGAEISSTPPHVLVVSSSRLDEWLSFGQSSEPMVIHAPLGRFTRDRRFAHRVSVNPANTSA